MKVHDQIFLSASQSYDWRREEAGRHEFSWDGLNKSGEMNLLEHPKLNMNLNAFSLPDNTIIVKGVQVDYSEPNPDYHAILKGKHFHYPHPRIYFHQSNFHISFSNSLNFSANFVLLLRYGNVFTSIGPI